MQFSSPISRLFAVVAIATCLFALSGCGNSSRSKMEHARVQSILIHCRAYATDNDGRYPTALADLYPKYINLITNFYSPPNSAAEDKPQAYYYRPGLNVGAKVDEPLVVSPHVVKGKVNVGYLGGFVRTLPKEDAQKILGGPNWVQQAPSATK